MALLGKQVIRTTVRVSPLPSPPCCSRLAPTQADPSSVPHQGQSWQLWCPPLHMLCGQAWFLSYPHHPQAQFSRISGHAQPEYSFPVENTISFCPPFPLTASATYALATTEESSFESQHIYAFTGASFILYTFLGG